MNGKDFEGVPDNRYRIGPPADGILVQAIPPLLPALGRENIALGEGTALAARWNHRRSTDIDLTVERYAFEQRCAEIVQSLKNSGIANIRHGRGWLNGNCADGEFSMSTTSPLLPSQPEPQDRETEFGLVLEPVAEILARKLRFRMYGNGEFVARDFHDVCTAHERDPAALARALTVLSDSQREEIAREIASMGSKAVRLGRPLTDVHCPSWMDGLGKRAASLISPSSPEPGYRRGHLQGTGDTQEGNPENDGTDWPSPFEWHSGAGNNADRGYDMNASQFRQSVNASE